MIIESIISQLHVDLLLDVKTEETKNLVNWRQF